MFRSLTSLLNHKHLREPTAMDKLCTSLVFKQVHDSGNIQCLARVKRFHHDAVVGSNFFTTDHNSTDKKHTNLKQDHDKEIQSVPAVLHVVIETQTRNFSQLFYVETILINHISTEYLIFTDYKSCT